MKTESTSTNPISGNAASLRLDPRSLAQEAYEHIKRLILSGAFQGGEKIPEERIASILNVSRTPIREALRQLEQYGLVEIKPRSYVKVAGVTEGEAAEIASVRIALETLAIKALLAEPDRINFSALYDIGARAMAKLEEDNVPEAFVLDSAFHLELVRQSGNETLLGILERLDAKNQLVRIRAKLSAGKYGLNLREHREMVELLTAGKADALFLAVEKHITPRY